MEFDQILCWLGIFQGRFDGHKIVITKRGRLIACVWFLLLIYQVIRFVFYLTLPVESDLLFYLGDYQQNYEKEARFVTHSAGFVIACWNLSVFLVFSSINRKSDFAFWLIFFILPTPFESSGNKFAQYNQFRIESRKQITRFIYVFVSFTVLMINGMYINYFVMPTPNARIGIIYFFYAFNCIICNSAANYEFLVPFTLPLLSFKLSLLINYRLNAISKQFQFLVLQTANCDQPQACRMHSKELYLKSILEKISKSKRPIKSCIQLIKIKQCVNSFQICLIDLFKINRFWKQVWAVNYFFGLSMLVFLILTAFNSSDFFAQWTGIGMSIFLYMTVFVLPVHHMGNTVADVRNLRKYVV